MTQEEIRAKSEDVTRRLKEHDAARKLIEAERLYLQHVCPHPNPKTWTSSDYKCGTDYHWLCEDCLLQRVQ